MAFWSDPHVHPRAVAVALAICALLLVAGPAYTQVYSPNMDPPTLISPADGTQTTGDPNAPPGYVSYPPLGIPTFVWSAVPGATKYKLEVSASPVFQPLIVLRDNLKYTHYTPTGEGDITGPGFTDHTLFYWRVSAWDPQANAWTQPSVAWSFTRNWGLRPATLSPTHLSTLPFTPRFEWTPVIGTREYELQIATSPNFQTPTTYRTKNPYFTPPNALANDVDYWWRVRARDKMDNSGDWSNDGNGWQLRVRWSYWSIDGERRPRPLTPPNLTVIEGMPLFSWTPVAGAKTYILQVSNDPGFGSLVFYVETPNTAYASSAGLVCNRTYYWRVRAKNADGYYGQWNSDTPAINYAFLTPNSPPGCVSGLVASAPSLFYPLSYYDPSINVGAFSDRTIPIGTFMWDHIPGATAYTLEVDDTPLFNPPLWTTTTQNLSVSLDVPFDPGTDYYWRVRPDLVSACDPSLSGGDRCSDIWNTRVDPSLLGGHTAPPPQLLRPTYKQEADLRTYGYESVEYWPLFEWLPVTGATGYRIQIAKYSDMTGIIDDHITRLTNYTPLTRYPWGTYYWRVCALDTGGNCSGGWSSVYRFLVSSQIQVAGIANNGNNDFPSSARLGTDPPDDALPGGFDLRELYTAVGRTTGPDMWYIGLQAAAPITGPVRYGIYLDKNRAECINAPPSCDSGADRDPLVGLSLTATPPHWPEYAIYVDAANSCAAPTALLYSWTGTAWGVGIPLPNLQGWVACDPTTGFVKLAVPFTAIGTPYSISFMAFSANRDTGQTTDTVPQNAENNNLTTLISFATDSMGPSPVLPPNNPAQSGARIFHPSVPILMWHTLDNMLYYRFQVALDYGFSNIYRNEQGSVGQIAYDELNPYYTSRLAYADNSTYYWRMAVVYSNPLNPPQAIFGQYGQSSQFSKFAKVPVNLRVMPLAISGTITYTWRTPTFTWDAAEAASQYRLRVYPGGSSTPAFSVETSQTDYTWTETLDDGTYRWTLEAKDADGGYSTNIAAGWFTKVYSAVVPLYPLTPTATLDPLEFRWQPLSVATRYQLQTASDPNFSSNVNTYTTFGTVFTPEQKPSAIRPGYDWYWRVRIIDGSNRYGPWVQLHIGYNSKIYIPLVVK